MNVILTKSHSRNQLDLVYVQNTKSDEKIIGHQLIKCLSINIHSDAVKILLGG